MLSIILKSLTKRLQTTMWKMKLMNCCAAIDLVVEIGQASVSYLQRKLKLGYGRAARIVDQMELRGIVGPFEGSKPRAVLISREEWAEMQMNNPDLDVNNSR